MSGDRGGDQERRKEGTETDWKLTGRKDGNREGKARERERASHIYHLFRMLPTQVNSNALRL